MIINGQNARLYSLKMRGNFLMLPPTHEAVVYTGVSMYRIEGIKIAEIWETRDTLGIMRQINPEIGVGHHAHQESLAGQPVRPS